MTTGPALLVSPVITIAEAHPALCVLDAVIIAVRGIGAQIISERRRLRPGLTTRLVR